MNDAIMHNANLIITGAILMMISVILGAFGSHMLKNMLSEYSLNVYKIANEYQFYHSLGILFLGLMPHSDILIKIAFYCMLSGILFFSGSLYVLAITNIKILGAITPIGGALFIISWLLVAISAIKIH